MSVLIPLILGQAIVGGQGQSSAGDLSGYYNPRREVSFSGVVTGKTKGRAPGYAEGMSILVRTGKTIREVELGPTWYVGRQQAAVNLGDKVKVTGVPLVIDKRQRVVLARQIMRGKSVLALRDNAGNPYWTARRSTRMARSGGSAQRMDTMFQGTIGGMKMFDVNGESYAGYVLNTPNGPMDVAVAPSWYWNNQPTYFNVGDNVRLYGGRPIVVGGTGLGRPPIIVNSFDYSGGSVILSNGGGYVYGGFRNLP